jgi:hypothetical protein
MNERIILMFPYPILTLGNIQMRGACLGATGTDSVIAPITCARIKVIGVITEARGEIEEHLGVGHLLFINVTVPTTNC